MQGQSGISGGMSGGSQQEGREAGDLEDTRCSLDSPGDGALDWSTDLRHGRD